MDPVVINKGRRYWTLRASELYAGEEPLIDWALLIPPASGTRDQRTRLISATKQALEAMVSAPRRNAGQLSHATVQNWFGVFRRLVRWMTLQGIWRYSDLTPEDAAAFLHSIQPRRGGMPEVSLNTVQRHINILRCLWDFRSDLRDALCFDITHIDQDLVGAMRLRRSLPWRPIDEADAIRLLHSAKDWTDTYAAYVGGLLQRLWAEHSGVVGITRRRAKRRREAFYRGLAQEPAFCRLADRLGMAGRLPYVVLRAAVAVLEGAALTSIMLLVGLRAREAVRLDEDCVLVPEDGDPDSLQLAGIAAKKGGRRRTWAITGAVKEAVDALRLMLAAPRQLSKQASLLLQGSAARCAVFPGSRMPERADPGLVSVRLRQFANAAFPGEPDLAQRLHAHAARKTFARFVVMRDKRVLESLAYHYGCWRRLKFDPPVRALPTQI